MTKRMRMGLMCAVFIAGAAIGRAEPATVEDPTGIIKKPIPDRLVVFTFDDSCASHATVAAPIRVLSAGLKNPRTREATP